MTARQMTKKEDLFCP